MAQSREEAQRRRRRQRLVKGLVVGAAAVGVPAAVNWWVSRRAHRLPESRWGSGDRWPWHRGAISFERLGEGPPLVLLHSLGPGHSSAEWRRAAEVLAPEFELFAPDFLGWGDSERPRRRYRPALYVDQIRDFLETVVGGPAALVAAGLAAPYALEVALREPAMVPALALVAPHGFRSTGTSEPLRDRVTELLLRLPILGTSAVNLATSRSAIAAHLRREVFSSPAAVDDALIDAHYQSSHRPGARHALAACLAGLLDHGVGERLGEVTQPVWLAWGRHSAAPSVERADLWLRALPTAELEVFEQCGSLPHAESPDEFAKKLETFLSALAS